MTRQNTQKPKYIVTIKKIKHQLKQNWQPSLVEAWNSSLPFARDS
jgi:hypothetical protein